MNLPDFKHDVELNKLRRAMNAVYLEMDGKIWDPIGIKIKLAKPEGIDVEWDDIDIEEDGSILYRGQKVLLYIRDQWYSEDMNYRFHTSNCATLKSMREQNKFERYVVSTSQSGRFIVNIKHRGKSTESNQSLHLKICKHCLKQIHIKEGKGKENLSKREKNKLHVNFNIAEFLGISETEHTTLPKYTDITAPINEYPKDWNQISTAIRVGRKYICEYCGVNCSSISMKKYLHTHHVNGNKADNVESNLKVLCLACHATHHPNSWSSKHINEMIDVMKQLNMKYEKTQSIWNESHNR